MQSTRSSSIRLAASHVGVLVSDLGGRSISPSGFVSEVITTLSRQLKYPLIGLTPSHARLTRTRLELLDVATGRAAPDGLWLEFGVFEGRSLNYIAERTHGTVYGFDSFQGLPSYWHPGAGKGAFSTDGRPPAVRENVRLVPGYFAATLPDFLEGQRDHPVSFAHLDCDLYESGRTVLHALGPRVRAGTVLVFDDFLAAMPDDLYRAFREWRRERRIEYEWLGFSFEGSVALRIRSAG
jgi:hypothetical protein